ncbi:MAG: DUF433 domain-containing protein [Phycisphaerales bacterium]
MDWRDHIGSDPAICHGKPCIRGTRIPVSVVLANLADGMSPEAILKEYPTLSDTAIRAALLYAAELVQREGPNRGAA